MIKFLPKKKNKIKKGYRKAKEASFLPQQKPELFFEVPKALKQTRTTLSLSLSAPAKRTLLVFHCRSLSQTLFRQNSTFFLPIFEKILMSIPQEHDYIGLSEALPSEKSSEKIAPPSPSSNVEKNKVFNLKETELRLGLPGSEAPERKGGIGVSLFGKDLKDESKCGFSQKILVSGAKRGFSDAINGAGKWGLSINGGSEADLGKNAGINSSNSLKPCLSGSSVKKEIPAVNPVEERKNEAANTAPASKAQVVGWPPIRSFRKNTLATNLPKNDNVGGKSGSGCLYVKVSMDGAPYLRKIDLKTYCSYAEISSALEKMFSCFTIGQCGQGLAAKEHLSESHLMDLLHGSEYVLTYEDKDGDWMLVGDVPWEMFTDSCRRLRIMKGSDAIGLAPRTMQKCKSQN